MRGHGLRAILHDIQSVLSAGGATAQAKAVVQLSDALKPSDEKEVADIAASVGAAVAAASAPAWQKHASALRAAGLDEAKFQQAFLGVSGDKSLKKSDVAAIAKDYGLRVEAKASTARLLEQVKGAFYEKLYERDANTMAKRATPW